MSTDNSSEPQSSCFYLSSQADCEDNECCWYNNDTAFQCDMCQKNTINDTDQLMVFMSAIIALLFSMMVVFLCIILVTCIQKCRRQRRIRQQQLIYNRMRLLQSVERVFAFATVIEESKSPVLLTQESVPVAKQFEENRTTFPTTFAIREFNI